MRFVFIKFSTITGASVIERPASIDDGFSQEAPLVYHLGHKTPSGNINLYQKITEQLATTVKERLEPNKKSIKPSSLKISKLTI